MKDRTPREYAEAVLGKAASSEQLDELFELAPDAHPIVTHGIAPETKITRGGIEEIWHNLNETTVEIFDHRPGSDDQPAACLVTGYATCSPDDQWERRRGTTIAFGRGLAALRVKVTGGEAGPGGGPLMALNDVEHVEAVAIIRKLIETGITCDPDVTRAAVGWLEEHHPSPSAYIAAARSCIEAGS